ncbi:MAG TPA: hypothetical protein O0W90_03680 [Methanocorpusculum sp.]|nr:hypothetical protein [Methanocorpusculum sp.]
MDTRMKFLEHELAAQEQEIANKQEKANEALENPESIKDLEARVRELEAMVKGLTEELLDLKSVSRRLNAQIEKLGGTPVRSHPEAASRFGIRREVTAEPIINEKGVKPAASMPSAELPPRNTVSRAETQTLESKPAPKRTISSPVPEPKIKSEPKKDIPVENLKPGEFEYVMQPDGSIQKRRKTARYDNVIIAGTGYAPGHTTRSSAIRPDSSAVIEAEEDDTAEIK